MIRTGVNNCWDGKDWTPEKPSLDILSFWPVEGHILTPERAICQTLNCLITQHGVEHDAALHVN
jgi:hypothetical protein